MFVRAASLVLWYEQNSEVKRSAGASRRGGVGGSQQSKL